MIVEVRDRPGGLVQRLGHRHLSTAVNLEGLFDTPEALHHLLVVAFERSRQLVQFGMNDAEFVLELGDPFQYSYAVHYFS